MSSANTSPHQGISIPTEESKFALVIGVNNSSIALPYRPALRFTGHTDSVNSVAFSPDGCLAITYDWNGWVYLWRIDALKTKDPLAIYVAYYPVVAMYWQDTMHVVLADNGGPRNCPYFYHLKLEGMG